MAASDDSTSVLEKPGPSLTSARRRPLTAVGTDTQVESIPNVSKSAPKPEPQKEPPIVSTKAIIASVVLAIVIYVNMSYGRYKDLQALDQPPLDKDYALHKMLQWMEAGGTHGALPPRAKIEVRNDLGDCKCIRGVAATADIETLETIVEIPFSQILFDGSEQHLPACTEEAQWDVRLASALLREKDKGPASPFFYYIQALPDEILAAVTLDDEDLEKVRYDVGRGKLAAQRPWMSTLHLRCLKEHPELIAHAIWEEFRWAIAVVQSRSFGLLGKLVELKNGTAEERRSDGSGLVPLMDLLNHNELHSAYWEISPDGRYVLLKAARNITRGEEVCDSYGRKGNDELLISYGFVIHDNPHEYMALFDHIEDAIDWLFAKFPCKTGAGGEVVSRGDGCQEEVLRLVRQRLEGVPVPPVVENMKADPTPYYASDIARMGLFVNGVADTRLVAGFEAAFSHACFKCALDSKLGTDFEGSANAPSLSAAVDEAKSQIEKASGSPSVLETYTVNGRVNVAIKLRVLELLQPFGLDLDNRGASAWRKPARKSRVNRAFKEQVIDDYNNSKLRLLLASLETNQ